MGRELEARASTRIDVGEKGCGRQVPWIAVDSTNKAPNGRASVRIKSNRAYNHGLFIVDLAHVPTTICGTWRGIGSLMSVNLRTLNFMTLHTGRDCTANKNAPFEDRMKTSYCDIVAPGQDSNAVCTIEL